MIKYILSRLVRFGGSIAVCSPRASRSLATVTPARAFLLVDNGREKDFMGALASLQRSVAGFTVEVVGPAPAGEILRARCPSARLYPLPTPVTSISFIKGMLARRKGNTSATLLLAPDASAVAVSLLAIPGDTLLYTGGGCWARLRFRRPSECWRAVTGRARRISRGLWRGAGFAALYSIVACSVAYYLIKAALKRRRSVPGEKECSRIAGA